MQNLRPTRTRAFPQPFRPGGSIPRPGTTLVRRARGLICLLVLATLPFSAGSAPGQNSNTPFPIRDASGQAPLGRASGQDAQADDPGNPADSQKRLETLNALRQKQMAEDSAKLLALATELKAEVDKAGKDTLSLDVMRKAEQIEKLAHSVREKMKETFTY